MTSKTTRFGRWSVTTRKDISTSSIPNTIRRDSQSGAGEIKIPVLLPVENLLTSCGIYAATRAADTKSATPSILSVVLPNGDAAMEKLEVIKTQPTDGASHHYTQIPHSNGTEYRKLTTPEGNDRPF